MSIAIATSGSPRRHERPRNLARTVLTPALLAGVDRAVKEAQEVMAHGVL